MIEKLQESRGIAIGFNITGTLAAEDIAALGHELDLVVAEHKKPMGLLIDLSSMHGATWAARWEEMRFLQKHTDHVARLAVVSNDKWEEIAEMAVVATAAMQAETRYFLTTEILHAWHWVRMSSHIEPVPGHVIYPGRGLFGDYTPEYTGL